MRRRVLPFLIVLPYVFVGRFASGERRDHELARNALEAGQIRPLSEILAGVEREFQGRVIEAELEGSDGRWRYEIKILPPDGRVLTINLDATTGAVIHTSQRTPSS